MTYIPEAHKQYDLLPCSREGGWEVFAYPSFLNELDDKLGDIEHGPRMTPHEARPSLLIPYGYRSVSEYLDVIEEYALKHEGTELSNGLRRLASCIERMNRKEDWSVLRYVGPEIPDTILGLTPGRCYYWPTSREFPFYDGVIDDEEFTSYASYTISPDCWVVLEDPTGMAADTMAGRRAIRSTSLSRAGKKLNEDDLREIHGLSRCHADSIDSSDTCGCYNCCAIYPSDKVDDLIEEADGSETGLCPYCGIDSVLPSASVEMSGYELNMDTLTQMEKFWFGGESAMVSGTLCWGIPTSAGEVFASVNGERIPLRTGSRIYQVSDSVALPYRSIDLDVADLKVGDIVRVGVIDGAFFHDDGDERSEVLIAKTADSLVGLCGYKPGYHSEWEELKHCYHLDSYNEKGFTYEIARDPASYGFRSGFLPAKSIPLAICELKLERFERELQPYFDDVHTAVRLATTAYVI